MKTPSASFPQHSTDCDDQDSGQQQYFSLLVNRICFSAVECISNHLTIMQLFLQNSTDLDNSASKMQYTTHNVGPTWLKLLEHYAWKREPGKIPAQQKMSNFEEMERRRLVWKKVRLFSFQNVPWKDFYLMLKKWVIFQSLWIHIWRKGKTFFICWRQESTNRFTGRWPHLDLVKSSGGNQSIKEMDKKRDTTQRRRFMKLFLISVIKC